MANALVRYGASGGNNVFTSSSQLPGVIKGLLHLDKLDTAYVRHVKFFLISCVGCGLFRLFSFLVHVGSGSPFCPFVGFSVFLRLK